MTYKLISNKEVINNYGHDETTAYLLLGTPSYHTHVLWSNIGTLGNGAILRHPCSRVPAIPDLRVIALMTAPVALAAARHPRPCSAPEEDTDLDRGWAVAHVND